MATGWDEFVPCWAADQERRTCNYPNIVTPWGDEVDSVSASWALECPSKYPELFSKVWRRLEADCGGLKLALLSARYPRFRIKEMKVGGMSFLGNSRNTAL
jgi:hypothetical protein